MPSVTLCSTFNRFDSEFLAVPSRATQTTAVAVVDAIRRSITTSSLILALAAAVTPKTALATQPPLAPAISSPKPHPASLVSAPPQASQPSVPRVSVRCVDAQGKPVPDAEVFLFQHSGGDKSKDKGRYVQSGPFTSDEQGRALCAEAIFMNERGNFDRWIYARVPGRLVGTARGAKWTNRAAFNSEGRVTLQPSRSIEGQVTVPAGFDPTKVMVRTRVLHITSGPGFFDYESFPREHSFPGVDTALPERFDCRPDARGRIRFSDVPVRGMLTLVAAGEGLAEAQWRNDGKTFDQPIQLTIPKESVVSGRVLSPDGKPAAGVEVVARLSPPPQKQIYYLSSFRALTDENGTFVLHGIPHIEFVLSARDSKKIWTFRPLENVLVEPDNDPHLSLRMETGTLVSGRVLDPDGKPVEGAAISALADTEAGPSPGLDDDFTTSTGKYLLHLPSGRAKLYFNSLPDGFAYPRPQIVKQLDIEPGQPSIKNLDFTLQRQAKPAR
jgi:hypothetical protein